jgi:hypothetical protein
MKMEETMNLLDFYKLFTGYKKSLLAGLHNAIGRCGESIAEKYFALRGFNVEESMIPDLKIGRNGRICRIEVKTSAKEKWTPKKYFNNHERYKKQFPEECPDGCIDEYLRVRLKLEISAEFNDDDLKAILSRFQENP